MSDIINPLQNISYTNKDFSAIYEEMLDVVKKLTYKWDPSISNESDPGVVLIKLNALIADKCNYITDKAALENFPLSVTQMSNARKLFSQLGYDMKWLQSATTKVSLSWVSENSFNEKVVIKPFTMVTDANDSVTYTLLGTYDDIDEYKISDITFNADSTNFGSVLCNAIQGVPVIYDVAGSTVITPINLDSNNRLYFSTNWVAENGVFIRNITDSEDNYVYDWKRVDNLSVQNFGTKCYKFGITDDGKNCYIEFPEDVDELFKQGVNITYIQTDADSGNISIDTLSKFKDTITASLNGANVVLDNNLVAIRNPYEGAGGESYETIESAYKNYKRLVGTFNTLVTLRDYINAIRNSNLVSNAIVCDRNNDIQTTCKVLTEINNIDSMYNYIEEYDNIAMFDAFSVKLYLLRYQKNVNSSSAYTSTFNLITNDNTSTVKAYIEDQKIINHDYNDILPADSMNPHECMFINRYPVNCTIITSSEVSASQKNDIISNIYTALYDKLNSKELDFGEKIEYELLYNTVVSADNRIKTVSLSNIDYSTQAVEYVTGKTLRYVLSSNTWESEDYRTDLTPNTFGDEIVNPHDGYIYTIPDYVNLHYINGNEYEPIYFVTDNSEELKLNSTVIVDEEAFINKVGKDNCYREIEFISQDITSEYGWQAEGFNETLTTTRMQGFFYNSSDYPTELVENVSTIKINVATGQIKIGDTSYESKSGIDSYIKQFINRNMGTASISFVYKKIATATPNWYLKTGEEISEEPVTFSDYGMFVGGISKKTRFKVKLSYANQVRTDVWAKNVLAGKTQLFTNEEPYDYKLNQSNGYIVDNIDKISGSVSINFTKTSNTYTIRDNENLQFYSPNLIDGTTYSNYVKIEYNLLNSIKANSSYKLKSTEYIVMYWTETDEETGIQYRFKVYREGSIIQPSFNIISGTYNSICSKKSYGIMTNATDTGYVPFNANAEIKSISNTSQILSGSKTIKIKELKDINISYDSKYYMYWILNDDVNGKYKLFEDGSNTRLLNNGEYFIYTDAHKKNLTILGGGTKITSNADFYDLSKHTADKFVVDVLDISEVLSKGMSILENHWFLSSNLEDIFIEGSFTESSSLSISENAFTSFGEGTTVRVTAKEPITDLFVISIDTDAVAVDNRIKLLSNFSNVGQHTFIKESGGTWKCDEYSLQGITEDALLSIYGIEVIDSSSITSFSLYFAYDYSIEFNGEATIIKQKKYNFETQSFDEIIVGNRSEVSLSNFLISYRESDEDDWVTLETLDLGKTSGWIGRTTLTINISSSLQQYLLSRQKIYYTKLGDSTKYEIEGASLSSEDATDSNLGNISYPVTLLSKNPIHASGYGLNSTIYYTLDSSMNVIKNTNSLYIFKEIQSLKDSDNNIRVAYTTYGRSLMYLKSSSEYGNIPGKNRIVINFSLPVGDYILPLKNLNEIEKTIDEDSGEITWQNIVFDDIKFKTENTALKDVTYIYDDSKTIDDDAFGTHYLTFSITNDVDSNEIINCTLVIDITTHSDITVMFDNIYKYSKPSNLSKVDFDKIINMINFYDTKHYFKYINKIDESININNPVDANAFLNPRHVYNKFTICEISNINIR